MEASKALRITSPASTSGIETRRMSTLVQIYLLSAWRMIQQNSRNRFTLLLVAGALMLLLFYPDFLLQTGGSRWSGALILGIAAASALRSIQPVFFKDQAFLSLLLSKRSQRVIWLLKYGALYAGIHALPLGLFYNDPRKLITYVVAYTVNVGMDEFLRYLQARKDRKQRRSGETPFADVLQRLPIRPQTLALVRRDWLQVTSNLTMIIGAATIFFLIMAGPLTAVYIQRSVSSSIWNLLFIIPSYLFLLAGTEIDDRPFLSQIQKDWQIMQRQSDMFNSLQTLLPNIVVALAVAGLLLDNWPPWKQIFSFALVALTLSILGSYVVGSLRLRFPRQILKRLLFMTLFTAVPLLIPIIVFKWRPRSHAHH